MSDGSKCPQCGSVVPDGDLTPVRVTALDHDSHRLTFKHQAVCRTCLRDTAVCIPNMVASEVVTLELGRALTHRPRSPRGEVLTVCGVCGAERERKDTLVANVVRLPGDGSFPSEDVIRAKGPLAAMGWEEDCRVCLDCFAWYEPILVTYTGVAQ